MKPCCADLIHALTQPTSMASLSPRQWDLILRQARSAGLLARLAALARQEGIIDQLPKQAWHILEGDLTFAQQQATAVRYELRLLDRALKKLDTPVLLLKGGAYVALDHAASAGRFMTDIDILITKARLQDAESALTAAGWMTHSKEAYDERYYRVWMHELPPMQHMSRHTLLDVHHNLLPETARIRTHPELVLASAHRLPGYQCLYVPDHLDLILHSATHLMHEGEWGHGLRDLSDLYLLIAPHVHEAGFWQRLLVRAQALNLQDPLHYVLVELQALFGLSTPAAVAHPSPGRGVPYLMTPVIRLGVLSFHASCRTWLTPAAEFALYVRSHWLRMPPHLLIPHLLYKAWKKRVPEKKSQD
jgi:hypothetical protein